MNSLHRAKTKLFPIRCKWLIASISHSHTASLLSQPSVLVSNRDKVIAKIETFEKASSESLQVVSDFDSTLTYRFDNDGGKLKTSFSLLEYHPGLSVEFQNGVDKLRDKYDPMDADPTLKKVEKGELMKEYVDAAVQLWVTEQITRTMVEEAVAVSKVKFRGGFKDMNDSLNDANIPLLILSAGLATTIELLLQRDQMTQSNVKILSNYLTFDENTFISGTTQPYITTVTKAQTHLLHPEYFESVRDRTNLVVMGDRIEDAGVQGCYQHVENVITIGFLNENVDDVIDLFQETYDIVLLGDPDLSFVRTFFDIIL